LAVDYLIIGNVTKDLLPDGGFTIGGTVTYSARTALAMDCRVTVVTSAAQDLDLGHVWCGIEVERLPSENTLTFENIYTPAGREQFLHAVASPLSLDCVPQRWRQPDILHLAPLAGECDLALSNAFPGALVGVTPQGFMRAWDESGRVYYSDWQEAADLLPRVDAAVLSIKDVAGDEATIERFARLAPILVITLGPEGCRVYVEGKERHVPVTPVPEVDPTGAGDIFAAAFFVRLRQGDDPWSAAHFANCVASMSVKRRGWAGTPTRKEIAAAC
jgi:sugar/nucleoside kinase (ribokinase family)